MPIRLATALLAAVFAIATVSLAAGCGGVYTGKPEKLPKPKKKKKPEKEEGEDEGSDEIVWDEKCRVDFFGEPTKRRKPRDGRRLTRKAERSLFDAEEQEGPDRIASVKDALATLENALKKDPYGPEPTFRMAMAYALVNKKKCALLLLERLATLEKHPDVTDEAGRVIKKAMVEPAFDPFRKEADTALGQ